jgi:hypothetical protein
MMDESKTPPTHLGSCRYQIMPRGFGFAHHSIALFDHEVPNPSLTIRNFCIAVSPVSLASACTHGGAALASPQPPRAVERTSTWEEGDSNAYSSRRFKGVLTIQQGFGKGAENSQAGEPTSTSSPALMHVASRGSAERSRTWAKGSRLATPSELLASPSELLVVTQRALSRHPASS